MQTYRSTTERVLDQFTIGQLAHMTGINAKAIRYYESVGLLPHPERNTNGYRRYSQTDVSRLTLLRRLRLLGIPLSALGPLLAGVPDARCVEIQQEVLTLVHARLLALDQEIAELHQLRVHVESYQHQLARCHPDEHVPFSACLDLSCFAFSNEIEQKEQPCETTCCV